MRPDRSVLRPGSPRFLFPLFLILSLSPILVYWFDFAILVPAPFYAAFDPEMAYFADSLSPFAGRPYGYVDHPGTPVDILGSIFFGLIHVFQRSGNFVLDQLQHPEIFFAFAHTFQLIIFLLCAAALFCVASRTLTRVGLWVPAAIAVMFFAIDREAVSSTAFWSHNSFNFPFGAALLLLLFSLLSTDKNVRSVTLLVYGVLAGILATFSVYYCTWVASGVLTVLVYFWLRKRPLGETLRAPFLVLVGGLGGYVLSVLPVLRQMPAFLQFVLDLSLHQGRYGTGAAGFFSLAMIRDNALWLIAQEPLLFLALGVLAVVGAGILLFRRQVLVAHPGLTALAIGLLFHAFALFFLIIKERAGVYTLSIAASLPVLALTEVRLLELGVESGRSQWVYRGSMIVASALIGAGMLSSLSNAISSHNLQVQRLNAVTAAFQRFESQYAARVGRSEKDLLILYVWDFRNVFDGCYGLVFGTYYAKWPVPSENSTVCPNRFFLVATTQKVQEGQKLIPVHNLNWDLVVISSQQLASHGSLRQLGIVRKTDRSDLTIIENPAVRPAP